MSAFVFKDQLRRLGNAIRRQLSGIPRPETPRLEAPDVTPVAQSGKPPVNESLPPKGDARGAEVRRQAVGFPPSPAHPESDLQAREQRLRLALQAGGLGIWEHILSENHISVSPEFCQILAFPIQTTLAHDAWMERIHPEDRNLALGNVQRMLDEQTAMDIEHRICLPNGGVRWIRAMASPVVEHGRVERVHGVVQEITDRKQAETELRQFSLAVGQSPVSVVITDLQGAIEYVNPKFCAVTGYSFEEVCGKNPRVLKSGELPAECYRQLWATITAGGEWHGEFHNKKKDGGLFWESASISPVRDAKGNITHFIGIKEDITLEKKLEEALWEKDRRHKAILDNIPDPVWLKDAQGRYLAVNKSMRLVFDQPLENIIGKTAAEVFPDYAADLFQGDQAAIVAGKSIRCENRVRDAAGRTHWLEIIRSPIFDEHGGLAGLAGVARDITVRKQTDEAQKEQLALREWLAKIAANLPGIIFSFRLRPNGSTSFPYISPTVAELCGVRAEEVVADATPLYNLIPLDERAGLQASIAESARKMLPWRAEFKVRHPNSGFLWVEGHATPERDADGSLLWHGFLSDISERKQAEAALREFKENEERARRELEHEHALNEIKGSFVSLVSHEFRTPLSAINMAAFLLSDYGEQMKTEDRIGQARDIQHAVGRMTSMMEDFLIHEKIQCGKMKCQPARMNVEVFCRSLIPEVVHSFQPDRLVEFTIEPAVREAFLDEKILRHILGNLLSNAVKYSSDGQPVVIEVKRVADPARIPGDAGTPPEEHLQLKISDSGIGIPEADLAKVFQAFHRGTNVGNRPGTGMGLAIVKQFVDLHQGTIRLESKEGHGTSVWVCLPIGNPALAERGSPPPQPTPIANQTVDLCTKY